MVLQWLTVRGLLICDDSSVVLLVFIVYFFAKKISENSSALFLKAFNLKDLDPGRGGGGGGERVRD